MSATMTQAVLDYQKTGEGWESLYAEITVYVYEFPYRWTDWDEDRCSDFFLGFYPRIPGLVARFRPHFTFETYLAASLRWFIKTFTKRLVEREDQTKWSEREFHSHLPDACIEATPEPMGDFALAPDECPLELDENGRLKNPALRRRILFAVLLQSADIEFDRLSAIAKLVDVDPDWLQDTVEKARTTISNRLERREELRHRRNECWYKMEVAEKRIESEGPYDEISRRIWERKSRTWRKRHRTACEGIRRLKTTPSHHDIARLLNLPEGTVASGLHFLRKQWGRMEGSPPASPSGQSPKRPGPGSTHRIESRHGTSASHGKSS